MHATGKIGCDSMSVLCSNCQKRPTSFVSNQKKSFKGHIHGDKRHDLCRQCFRAQTESHKHTRAQYRVIEAQAS
jgi:hypothetical protein